MRRGRIISFALTAGAFRAGHKTVTRRTWAPSFARSWKPGDPFQAYDRSPRNGGKRIGYGLILSVRAEALRRLVEDEKYGAAEIYREGGLWFTVDQFLKLFPGVRYVWRVEFVKVQRGIFLATLRGEA